MELFIYLFNHCLFIFENYVFLNPRNRPIEIGLSTLAHSGMLHRKLTSYVVKRNCMRFSAQSSLVWVSSPNTRIFSLN